MYKKIGSTEQDRLLNSLKRLLFFSKINKKGNIKKLYSLAEKVNFASDTKFRYIPLKKEDINLIEGYFLAFDEDIYKDLGIRYDEVFLENLTCLYNQSLIRASEYIKDELLFHMEFDAKSDDYSLMPDMELDMDEIDSMLKKYLEDKLNCEVDSFDTTDLYFAIQDDNKEMLENMQKVIDIDETVSYFDSYCKDCDEGDYDEEWNRVITYLVVDVPKVYKINNKRLEEITKTMVKESGSVYEGGFQASFYYKNKLVIAFDGYGDFIRSRIFWSKLNEIEDLFKEKELALEAI